MEQQTLSDPMTIRRGQNFAPVLGPMKSIVKMHKFREIEHDADQVWEEAHREAEKLQTMLSPDLGPKLKAQQQYQELREHGHPLSMDMETFVEVQLEGK